MRRKREDIATAHLGVCVDQVPRIRGELHTVVAYPPHQLSTPSSHKHTKLTQNTTCTADTLIWSSGHVLPPPGNPTQDTSITAVLMI